MDKNFEKAFAELIREQVLKKNEVVVEGLGSFDFEHRQQYQQQYNDGRVVMMPPKDTIRFIPENKD